jgi:hypothetical protein
MNISLQSKPLPAPSNVADSGKIVLGVGLRLPTAPAQVADKGAIRFGAGLRMPAERKAA